MQRNRRRLNHYLKYASIIIGAFSILSLTGCSATSSTSNTSTTSVTIADNQLQQALKQWSEHTGYTQTMTPISACRYEIRSEWSNIVQGFHRATSSQRFSFTHDLRSIDHTPDHVMAYEAQQKQRRQSLDITFNRPLPITTEFYDSETFEYFSEDFTAGNFSLLGVYKAPVALTQQLIEALNNMATACNNNLNQQLDFNRRILGRWELHGLENSIAMITISPQRAVLQQAIDDIITGPYQITKEQNYYRLTINPLNQQQRVDLAIEFVNSVFARVLMLENSDQQAQFGPIDQLNSSHQPLSLIRLGDIL